MRKNGHAETPWNTADAYADIYEAYIHYKENYPDVLKMLTFLQVTVERSMQIYFMHGFNSGPNSSTGKMIKKELGDKYGVRVLSYDSSKTFQENFKQLAKKINGNDFPIFIGTSLGAYYAYHLANYFQTKCVLLNPCFNPQETLGKFIGENISFEDGHKWTLTNETITSYAPINKITFDGIHRFVVIGENDEVIDPLKSRELWKINADVYILQNEGHSISSIIPIKNELVSFLNRVAG